MHLSMLRFFTQFLSLVFVVKAFDTTKCSVQMSCADKCNAIQLKGGVKFLCLHGNKYQQGLMYGKIMKQELLDTFQILMNFYPSQKGYNYSYIAEIANYWTDRYSFQYNWFIVGMAKGARISLQNAKILNSMVALGVLDEPDTCAGRPPGVKSNKGAYGAGCAYTYVNPKWTKSGSGIIGRNYDYFYPFYDIASNIVVTVMVDEGKIPTAIISMPGQIYCQNCVNSYEIFMELNNGGASAGFCGHWDRKGLLINMLEYLQNAGSLHQLDKQMQNTRGDISLIISAGDRQRTISWEFAPYIGMETYVANENTPHVITNFYQSKNWKGKGLLPVTDESTWHGFTRFNHLTNLVLQYSRKAKITAQSFMELWSTRIEQGGAVWKDTIIQLVWDTSTGILYIRSVKHHGGIWVPVNLRKVFTTVPPAATEVPNFP